MQGVWIIIQVTGRRVRAHRLTYIGMPRSH
ncbi:hypothetical protein E2C01_093664 [Portunus trituberculatus]|uniref:Uncharacterized protein n=1 Tax=Portunus trituberculatus TaxID=210409 RepID=A0A5B7JNB0_PORTR|nr:hypothetical protein [Portunus trituberculatus]